MANPAVAGTENMPMVDPRVTPPPTEDVEEAFDALAQYAEFLITLAYSGFRSASRVAQIKHLSEIARVADWYTKVCASAGSELPLAPSESIAYVGRLLQAEYENTDNMVEMLRVRQARIRDVQLWLQAAGTATDSAPRPESRAIARAT